MWEPFLALWARQKRAVDQIWARKPTFAEHWARPNSTLKGKEITIPQLTRPGPNHNTGLSRTSPLLFPSCCHLLGFQVKTKVCLTAILAQGKKWGLGRVEAWGEGEEKEGRSTRGLRGPANTRWTRRVPSSRTAFQDACSFEAMGGRARRAKGS